MSPAIRLCLVFCLALGAGAGRAEMSALDLHSLVTGFLARQAAISSRASGGTASVELPPHALPAKPRDCAAPDVFLAPGRQAWGRTVVGVRCLSPRWTIYVPARVRVEGTYLIAARPLAAGQSLTEGDWTSMRGDLAAQPAGVLFTPEQAAGRTLRRAVSASTPLVADQFLATRVVERGQKVRVVSRGEGFEVANQGEALAPAADGQTVSVKLEGGRTIQGVARPGGVVEVSP